MESTSGSIRERSSEHKPEHGGPCSSSTADHSDVLHLCPGDLEGWMANGRRSGKRCHRFQEGGVGREYPMITQPTSDVCAIYGSRAAHCIDKNAAPGEGTASFSYSLDDQSFVKIGNGLQMRFGHRVLTGNKLCPFNYATKSIGGYAGSERGLVYRLVKRPRR